MHGHLETTARSDCPSVSKSVGPREWRRPNDNRVTWCTHGERDSGELAATVGMGRLFRKLRPTPPVFSPLDEAIEASRAILDLEPHEDEGKAAYSEETWARAVEFVRRNAKWLWVDMGFVADLPEILPGPDGSIDLHWDYPTYEMLINIPTDPQAEAGFYGDDRGNISIKGKFDPNTFNHGLLPWLAKAK